MPVARLRRACHNAVQVRLVRVARVLHRVRRHRNRRPLVVPVSLAVPMAELEAGLNAAEVRCVVECDADAENRYGLVDRLFKPHGLQVRRIPPSSVNELQASVPCLGVGHARRRARRHGVPVLHVRVLEDRLVSHGGPQLADGREGEHVQQARSGLRRIGHPLRAGGDDLALGHLDAVRVVPREQLELLEPLRNHSVAQELRPKPRDKRDLPQLTDPPKVVET
mmetsp:Transcript_37651/g.102205  ORF Transcript_37651/g.102205 Transcript_37651/m.102205 type:complete len:223 (+) Transcript_37651:497-1165(+)